MNFLLLSELADAQTSSEKVSDAINGKPERLEAITAKLDEKSRVTKNWYNLGLKLGLEKKQLEDLKSGSNPTLTLMEFIYDSHKPDISVAEFEEIMNNFKRNDVLPYLMNLG